MIEDEPTISVKKLNGALREMIWMYIYVMYKLYEKCMTALSKDYEDSLKQLLNYSKAKEKCCTSEKNAENS